MVRTAEACPKCGISQFLHELPVIHVDKVGGNCRQPWWGLFPCYQIREKQPRMWISGGGRGEFGIGEDFGQNDYDL